MLGCRRSQRSRSRCFARGNGPDKNTTIETSLIIGETVIAKGAANTKTGHKAHGAPFKPEEILAAKKKWNFQRKRAFMRLKSLRNFSEEISTNALKDFQLEEPTRRETTRQVI